ncbi:MAG: DUF3592 domain-containing protein [Lachnospiraceae bacterium]
MLTASIVFIALGGLLVLAGYFWLLCSEGRQKYKGKTTGVVAGVRGEPDSFGRQAGIHDYFYAVITFYADGILERERYAEGSNPCLYMVNEEVQIPYNERKPEEFELYKSDKRAELTSRIYSAGFLCCCIGGIFFIIFANEEVDEAKRSYYNVRV